MNKATWFFFLILLPSLVLAQNGWQQDSVILVGSIADFQVGNHERTVSFTFREVVKRTPQTKYVAEVDASGHFSTTIPFCYAQDFEVWYQEVGTPLAAAPGDRLMLRINGNHTVDVIEGNRVKDNEDVQSFLKGLDQLDNASVFDWAGDLTAEAFAQRLAKRDTLYRSYLSDFRRLHQTSLWFDRLIDDFLTYATWQALMSYPEWHAGQNNLKKEAVALPSDYYAFLKRYPMSAANPLEDISNMKSVSIIIHQGKILKR